MKFFNPFLVWSLVPIADKTVTVTTNNDKTGYTASTVSDKTGYSLTAGSYVIHASNNQRSFITIANASSSNTGAISSVTLNRSTCSHNGYNGAASTIDSALTWIRFNSATQVIAERSGTALAQSPYFEVEETF